MSKWLSERRDKMLEKLIVEGEQVKLTCAQGETHSPYFKGENYEKWMSKCTLFLETKYPEQTLTKKFIEASKNAIGNGVKYLDTMMGILKALKEFESESE